MEIYPEDLGPRQCRQVLEDRMWCVGTDGGRAAAPPGFPSGRVQAQPKPRPASIRKYFVGSLYTVFAAWTIEIVFHFSFWGAFIFCTIIAILWRDRRGGQAHTMPSVQQGFAEPKTGTYARLTEAEITLLQNNLLKKGCDDPLLGMYLELVWAAMTLAPLTPSQTETERSAREAIRALGGAIETLPPRTLDGVPDSTTKLEAVAARLESEATGEPDPVVAASLHRRVEALRGQAETVARVRVLLRRNLALREELADQVGALRTSLAAAALGGDDSGPELAGLAARIRRVASEANAVTAARVEVDALLSQPHVRAGIPIVTEEARQQRLGLNGEAL
jgi:hypothetical protein